MTEADSQGMLSIIKWRKHSEKMTTNLNKQLKSGAFSDCAISCDGKIISAHRIVLSGISTLFDRQLAILTDKHPIIHLSDVSYEDICDILKFAYSGECCVEPNRIQRIMEVGRKLEVEGLMSHKSGDVTVGCDNIEPTNQFCNLKKDPADAGNKETVIDNSSEDVNMTPNEKETVSDKTSEDKTGNREVEKKIAIGKSSNNVGHKKKVKFDLKPHYSTSGTQSGSSSGVNRSRITKPFRRCSLGISSQMLPTEEKTFVCSFCKKRYSSKNSHYAHERECSLNPQRRIVECSVCKEKMKPSKLSRHKKIHSPYDYRVSI